VRLDHGPVDHVIGVANGGIVPALDIAAALGAKFRTVRAQHNRSDAPYQQATGDVQLDLGSLTQCHITGLVLIIDDICGSGATLRRVRSGLEQALAPGTHILTATLCLNTGATAAPDYSVWTVSDWVAFPWEKQPAETHRELLPTPTEVSRHA